RCAFGRVCYAGLSTETFITPPWKYEICLCRCNPCSMGQDRERIRSMNSDSYRNAIAEYVHAEAKPADKFSHQPRLYQLAKLLAGDRPFDDDVLYAAAWLHDIGVFLGHRPEDPAALANWDNV